MTCTFPDEVGARRAARYLVRRRLAACVQVLGPIRAPFAGRAGSRQRPNGSASPRPPARSRKLAAAVAELHPYEIPEVDRDADNRRFAPLPRMAGRVGGGAAEKALAMPLRELISGIQDPDPAVRIEAVDKLGRIGGGESAGALVLLLDDPDPGVRTRVGAALTAVGPRQSIRSPAGSPPGAAPSTRFSPNCWADCASEPASSSCPCTLRTRTRRSAPRWRPPLAASAARQAVPPLIELVRDLEDDVRITAARARRHARARSRWTRCWMNWATTTRPCASPQPNRWAASTTESRSGTIAHMAGTDPAPQVRRTATNALRRVSSWAVTPLVRMLAAGDPAERINAVSHLLDQGKAAIVPLTEMLVGGEPTVRASAAEVLGTIGDKAALASLVGAPGDPDSPVRQAAATALGHIRDRTRRPKRWPRPCMTSTTRSFRRPRRGLEALGELAVDPVFGLLNDGEVEVRIRATDVLGRLRHKGACDRLVKGLKENVTWVRIVSCQALGEICENPAVPALIEALKDRDAIVRAMAAEALGKLRDYQATMPLLRSISDDSELVSGQCPARAGPYRQPGCDPVPQTRARGCRAEPARRRGRWVGGDAGYRCPADAQKDGPSVADRPRGKRCPRCCRTRHPGTGRRHSSRKRRSPAPPEENQSGQ